MVNMIPLIMMAMTATAPTDCDRLAAHPEDPQRVTPGVAQEAIDYPVAISACERAVSEDPGNARLRYQLARLLFYTNQNQRAVEEMKRSADADHIQAQYIYGTFVVRGRPYAPTDLCVAEQYWRKAATAGRQAARIQYVRYTLKGHFARCSDAATDSELRAFVDAAGKDSKSLFETLFVEDFREALVDRPSAAVRTAWLGCAQAQGLDPSQRIRTRRFGEALAITKQLNDLILAGEKTITASSPWLTDIDPARRFFEGSYSIMIDEAGAPRAVLRTIGLKSVRFNDVSPEDSRYEGPPVRSIEAWRRVHQSFFERVLKPIGKSWSSDMPVTLERFEVVCRLP